MKSSNPQNPDSSELRRAKRSRTELTAAPIEQRFYEFLVQEERQGVVALHGKGKNVSTIGVSAWEVLDIPQWWADCKVWFEDEPGTAFFMVLRRLGFRALNASPPPASHGHDFSLSRTDVSCHGYVFDEATLFKCNPALHEQFKFQRVLTLACETENPGEGATITRDVQTNILRRKSSKGCAPTAKRARTSKAKTGSVGKIAGNKPNHNAQQPGHWWDNFAGQKRGVERIEPSVVLHNSRDLAWMPEVDLSSDAHAYALTTSLSRANSVLGMEGWHALPGHLSRADSGLGVALPGRLNRADSGLDIEVWHTLSSSLSRTNSGLGAEALKWRQPFEDPSTPTTTCASEDGDTWLQLDSLFTAI